MAGTSITFDGNNLQTTNIITQDIDHHSGPTKNAQLFGVAHANYSAIPFTNFPSKQITVTGELNADSITDMDNLIDTLKGYFIVKDKYLDIGYGGSTRRYVCTPQSPQITRPGGLTSGTFSIVFDCTYPFGQDVSTTTALSATGRTLAIYADTLQFNGTAPYQYPIITITYSAITGGTAKSVIIGNNSNGQQITVTRTWTAGDILQIDVKNQLVLVNGISIDWSGAFPQFPPGTQYIGYSDGLTTRTFAVDVTYYPMWM